MKTLTCKTLRDSVVFAGILLVIGLSLLPLAQIVGPGLIGSIISYSGFGLLLISPLVMFGVLLASLLPRSGNALEQCIH